MNEPNRASGLQGSPALEVAGLGRRLGALMYELLPLAAIAFVATALVILVRGGDPVPPGAIGLQLWVLGCWYGYFLISWTRGGQTLGMRAWRLHLRHRDGRLLAPGAASVRFMVALAGLGAAGLGHLWALFPGRRTWHDRAVGSQIYWAPKPRR